jgi:N-acyl homoserine lactone hydrolase
MQGAQEGFHKIHILITALQHLNSSYLVWQYEPEKIVPAPICSYLIIGQEPVLVDTAFGDIPALRKTGLEIDTKPEWDLVTQMKGLGVEPGDVKYIILTHLHMDHSGNLDRFPNARVILQRKELQYAASPLHPLGMPLGFKRVFYRGRDVADLVSKQWHRLMVIDGDYEVVPGIRCVLFGGHTHGTQGVYVDTAVGKAIITSDICPCFMNFETGGYMTGIYVNWDEVVLAQRKMIADGKILIPSHDPDLENRFPTRVVG